MIRSLNKKYLLVGIILYAILSGLLLNRDLPIVDEEPYYFLLSESILSGEGYRNIFYQDNPSNVEYPPFYPLIISLILLVFPGTIIGLKMFSILFGMGSLITIYLLFCGNWRNTSDNKYQKLPFNYCGALLLIICTNPLFLAYSVRIVAETSYLFFSLITILFLEKYTRQDNSNKLCFWGGLISLIISFYTKTLGLSLVMAVFVCFFIKKNIENFYSQVDFLSFLFYPG